MKKLICLFLTGSLVLSLAACHATRETTPHTSAAEVTESTMPSETESTASASETPATTETSKADDKIALSLNEVAYKLVKEMEVDVDNVRSTDKNYTDKNKDLGVLDYVGFHRTEDKLKEKADGFNSYSAQFYVIEYDINSTVYKNLSVGSEIELFDDGRVRTVVTAIVKQYVLCIEVLLGNDLVFTGEAKATAAPFGVGKVQKAYEAFIALKPNEEVTTTTGGSITSIGQEVLAVLGDNYELMFITDEKHAKDNKNIGVLNYMAFTNKNTALKKKVYGYDSYQVYIYLIEFDMSSAEFKNLSVGKTCSIFHNNAKYKYAVTAISSQYVLCIESLLGKGGNFYGETLETKPSFTFKELQDLCDKFQDIVPTPDGKARATLSDVTRDILKALGRTAKNTSLSYQDDADVAKNNKGIGVVNFVGIWHRDMGCDIYILEFDMDSKEYKDLQVGKRVGYFSGSGKSYYYVTAINKQYVLFVYEGKRFENYQPPFKDMGAQKAYEAFMKIK